MITKKDLKGLSKRELKEMLCLASQADMLAEDWVFAE